MPLTDLSIVRVFSPVRRQVENALRMAILQGELVPGQRLVERTVADQLGVSRPLLREALRQLEAEALITREGSRGPRVASVTSEDVRQLYAVRMALEVVAVREFVSHSGARHRKKIGEAVDRMEAAVIDAKPSDASKWKNEFYAILIAGSGNQVLEQFLQLLHNRIQLLRGISLSQPGRLSQSAKEIRTIHAAILNGDKDAAEHACKVHLEAAAEVTLAALRDGDVLRAG